MDASPKSMQPVASSAENGCNNLGISDPESLSEEVSELALVSGSFRNMQDELSANKQVSGDGRTDSEVLLRDVLCEPGSSQAMSQDNQAGAVEVSMETCRITFSGKTHAFWETQPVEQYQDRGQVMEEGPIARIHNAGEIRTEPYKLPKHYEWCTCDVNCKDTMREIYNLLSNHYVEDVESMFRCAYSEEFLRWALQPPGYFPDWHIGVRVDTTKRLVAFITGIPVKIRVRDARVPMAAINFLCIHKSLRSKRLAPLLIREVTRRVHLENIWQAVYTAGVELPTPITTCHYWHRPLNPRKLIEVGFSHPGDGMTMSQSIEHYGLPDKTLTPGFRAMERGDLPGVTQLLWHHLAQFALSPDLSEAEVEHWLLPVENVVSTFVVEDIESRSITDFCSFYTIASAVLGDKRHATTLKAAYSFYSVATKFPLSQLVNDLLIVAKREDYDVFSLLDIMQNQSVLKGLKFKLGDGQLQYYLYNYRLKDGLGPEDLGLILL